MDLKFKSRALVGSIYQKFESMCQEVDDFVNGETVKRFCCDVVQDLLPPSLVDPVKCETETLPLKQNIIGNYNRSTMGSEGEPVFDLEQTSVNQDPVDLLNKDIAPPASDTTHGSESELSLQDDDVFIYRHCDIDVEENVKEESSPFEELKLASPENRDLPKASSLRDFIDENCRNGIPVDIFPALVCGGRLKSSQKEGTFHNSDGSEFVSDVSRSPLSSQLAFSVVSDENKIGDLRLFSSENSLLRDSDDLAEFSHAHFTQKAKKISHGPASAIDCSSSLCSEQFSSESFPTVSCDNRAADGRITFPSSFMSLESNNGYSCFGNFFLLTPFKFYFAILLNSILADGSTSRTDGVVSLAGSSEDWHGHWCECTELGISMSSLEIGEADHSGIDIADPSMETIELSDKSNPDDGCVIVDDSLLHAVSCRARKLRSYKKKIQDAFAFKRRLKKEYEQLAIWYGDADIYFGHHPEQNLLPSTPITYLGSKKSPTDDLCDSDWELL